MIKCKNFSNRVISYGPGGYKCPCCGPNPKHRDKERKRNKKVFGRLIQKIVDRDLAEE